MRKVIRKLQRSLKNPIISNSSWGIVSQILQSVFLSLFFVLLARYYSTEVFAGFIIATALYQLISAFSTLGLSQWFIRELTGSHQKKELINTFFKLQIYSGLTFYLINVTLAFFLYDDKQIQLLTIFFGINIIFDNLINAIKCINIAEFKQKKTFVILSFDAFFKFTVTCFLFIVPFSIITLTIILVIVRFVTLNLFLKMGSSKLISLKSVFACKISFNYLKVLMRLNWPFIIIGSVSILNWRISTVIISKVLTKLDVANFEISYRIFTIALMLPVVVSATVFPLLIKYFKEKKLKDFSIFFHKVHIYYFLFGLFSFTFVYSFIDLILPAVFGAGYAFTGIYTKQMFLTILIFPTAFLQANVLISLNLEKLDMWFNVILLIINLMCCAIGLWFIKSLSVINFSIFLSFVSFHILQDIVLVRKDISSRRQVLKFYFLSIISISSYILLSKAVAPTALFSLYWFSILLLIIWKNKWSNVFMNYKFSKR
jgi:O-antigen/teichoic acid export membrane protein